MYVQANMYAFLQTVFYFTGAAIIVIMVIAVVIGILIFIGGLIYLKR